MAEYKMCPNTDYAIYVLEFIQRNYQKHSEDAGVQKYIEALQMGIDALKNQPTADVVEVVRCKDCKYRNTEDCGMLYECMSCGGQWSWEYDNSQLRSR